MNKNNNSPKRSKRGAVTIDNHHDRIRFRFTYRKERRSMYTGLTITDPNLQSAKAVAQMMERDIRAGTLDETLKSYKNLLQNVTGPSNDPVNDGRPDDLVKTKMSLSKLFDTWIQYKIDRQEIPGTVPTFYYSTGRMLKRWGEIPLANIEERLLREKYSIATFNDRLSVLKSFFTWGVKRKLLPLDPLEETHRKKGRKTKDAKRRPFTIEELRQVIEAVETDRFCTWKGGFRHSHYAPFLKFMIYTGVRNAEACGLTVQKVDFDKRIITIDQALARTRKGTHAAARVMKETKTGCVRYLPLAAELREILEPLSKNKSPEDFVFQSPKGLPIDDRMFQRRVFRPVLQKLGLEDRVLYSLRHSFGTRAVEQGMSLYQVAQLMGHSSIETTMRNYIHLINRPKDLPGL